MSKQRNTRRRISRTLGLLFLLVIFPLTSWYFLQTGLNFTKDKFDKMEELAAIDSFVAYPVYGDSITNMTVQGRMIVVAKPELNPRYLDSLSLIHQDLIEDEWVWLLLLNGSKLIGPNTLTSYPFLLDSSAVKLIEDFKYSKGDGLFDREIELKANEIALVDTNGTLRYVYDIRKKEDLDLFISHLVLLVPKE